MMTGGRLVFRYGEAFPADRPVAVFLVALSTALGDLLRTSKWLVGGNDERPDQQSVAEDEHLHFLRLHLAQLYEVRETIKHGRLDPDIAAFIVGLPGAAQKDLQRVMAINTAEGGWLLDAVRYVRNQTNHYGGKWNWQDTQWAMRQVATHDSDIVMANDADPGDALTVASS